MIIDMHAHAFTDKIAEKAIGNLAVTSGLEPCGNGTIAALKEYMKRDGVDISVVLNIAQKPGKSARVINEWAKSVEDESIISFGSVHPFSEDAVEEVFHIQSMGLRGIKFHPTYQLFDVDDRRVYPTYEAIQETGLPVVFHAGFDPLDKTRDYGLPHQFTKVIRDFPRMRIVLAHMGAMNHWEEFLELLAGKNLYIDTAVCARYMEPKYAERIMKQHGLERVLLGSDFPWDSIAHEMEWFEQMDFTSRQKDMIFSENARALLGI